jgi:hypothetical protein
MLGAADELLHTILHAAQLQASHSEKVLYAHVAAYDPKQHAVQCIIPAYTTGNGVPVLSGWIPAMSLMVGNGWGIQYVLKGGSTYQKPTAGELVALLVTDDTTGAYLATPPFFNSQMAPPGATTSLNPGELILKHESGSYIWFHENGTIEVKGPLQHTGTTLGFYSKTPASQPTIGPNLTGSSGAAIPAFVPLTGVYSADFVSIGGMLEQLRECVVALQKASVAIGTAKQ